MSATRNPTTGAVYQTMKLEATVELTPDLLADAFWEMDDTQQARFFSRLAEVSTMGGLSMQMFDAGQGTTPAGRAVMTLIGEMAK